jgi:hypothetical protein
MQHNIHIDRPEGVALATFINFVGKWDGGMVISSSVIIGPMVALLTVFL